MMHSPWAVTLPFAGLLGVVYGGNFGSFGALQQSANWDGFASLENIFTFGDSYTATGFDPKGPQPSDANPFGNPADFTQFSSANGNNWINYLTVKHNSSKIHTFNFASGGATIDNTIIKSPIKEAIELKAQIRDDYIANYAPKNATPSWTSSRSLFAFWIGINDVDFSYRDPNRDSLRDAVIEAYYGLVKEVYDTGARNFLFLNVPPVDKSPLIRRGGPEAVDDSRDTLTAFNAAAGPGVVQKLAAEFGDEVSVWAYDVHTTFQAVLDDPAQFPETSEITNTTGLCPEYNTRSPPGAFNETCGGPIEDFFWLNEVHPVTAFHDLVSRQLSELLQAPPNA